MKTTKFQTTFFFLIGILAFSYVSAKELDSTNFKPQMRSYLNHFSVGVQGAGEITGNTTVLTSIGYKHYQNKGALRAIVGANYNGSTSTNANFTTYKNELLVLSGRIGYQYFPQLIFNRIGTSLGVDIVGGLYNSSVTREFSDYKNESMLVGVSPNFGVEFYIIPKISLLIETRFDLVINQVSITDKELDGIGNITESYSINHNGYLTHIAPLSLFHVAYHF